MKTTINELKDMIENSMKAISTYNNRPGLLECEDYLYGVEEGKIRFEILKELENARKLMKSRKGWRWEVIKATKGNPFKLYLLLKAWNQNRKHGNRYRTKHKD